MPISVQIADLVPGMRLHRPVSNEYTVLLPSGKLLEQGDIDTLQRKFPDLSVTITDPLLDGAYEFQEDEKEREVASSAQKAAAQAFSKVRKGLAGRAEMKPSEVLTLQQATIEVMHYLNENPVTAILLEKTHSSDTYLQEHAANVFYVSMVVGNAVKHYIVEERERQSSSDHLERSFALNLTPLAMGCLLHDIGMLSLNDIYKTVGELSQEQRSRLFSHPLDGEKMLPPSISAIARMVVRTHHENYNGTGYPNGTTGDKLHVFSRIIRVADAFDAATSPRIYKKAKSEARVMWEMTNGPLREHYDPVIAKVLTHMLHPFPVGAKLKMSNGLVAVVVRQNPKSPFHPQVILAFDQYNNPIPREKLIPPIDLYTHKDLRILAHGDEDLSFLYQVAAVSEDNQQPRSGASNLFSYAYP